MHADICMHVGCSRHNDISTNDVGDDGGDFLSFVQSCMGGYHYLQKGRGATN